jgi:hypothetical protein
LNNPIILGNHVQSSPPAGRRAFAADAARGRAYPPYHGRAFGPFGRHKKVLRGEIARRIDLRFAPDIRFKADPSFDYGAKIDALLELPKVKRDLSKKQDKPE